MDVKAILRVAAKITHLVHSFLILF